MLLIQTNANQERVAEAALTASHRACRVYFPKVLTRRSHARRVDYVERPFLPRYGFVEQYDNWRVVRDAPGVSCIVASGEEVRRAVVEIRSREAGGFIPAELAQRFKDGDRVVYNGIGSVFRRMCDSVFAEITMAVLGGARAYVREKDLVIV